MPSLHLLLPCLLGFWATWHSFWALKNKQNKKKNGLRNGVKHSISLLSGCEGGMSQGGGWRRAALGSGAAACRLGPWRGLAVIDSLPGLESLMLLRFLAFPGAKHEADQ